ncbi:CRISPR-associated helicase Cas3' [bacterium]|nr:CRISPR-associated helicase Cas3' [bacterium]
MEVDVNIDVAWGKLHRSGNQLRWLSLIDHCIDVAAVTHCLLQLPTWRARLSQLAGRPLTETDCWRLTAIAFFHDIGKCSLGFWLKQFDEPSGDPLGARDISVRKQLVQQAKGNLRQCGHTAITLDLESEALIGAASEALPLEEICEQWNGELYLWAAISHHGEPIRPGSYSGQAKAAWTWRRCAQPSYDPIAQLRTLGDAARGLFTPAFAPCTPLPAPEFGDEADDPHNSLIHAFAGLISLADWIASNPAADYFPYDLAPGNGRWPAALSRARCVLRHMRLDIADAGDALRASPPAFGEVFYDGAQRFEPTATQAAMASPQLGQIVIVEDETGAGKTEAALWRFKALLEAGKVDSLALLLPTRVAAVALHKRVEQFLRALFPDEAVRPNSVLAVPGYLVSDGLSGTRLPGFEVLWPDQEAEQSAHRHWAAENSKRYLAAAVAVGTVDQALLGALKSRHAHLRGMCALRSLLVIDEVHASDAYMLQLIEHLLARHQRAGGHALLLSATLGGAARDRLLTPLDVDAQRQRADKPQTTSDYLAVPFPCVSNSNSSLLDTSRPDARQKDVRLRTLPAMSDAQAIAASVARSVRAGARVLVIRNTVAGAIAVQHAIEAELRLDHPALFRCKATVCTHHGRYAAVDRKQMDQAVGEAFGKASSAGARVLVGTQTLEQSLDIDADELFTDLCPVDVLLQRIGRLHRHRYRVRPAEFQWPSATVLIPEQRDLTSYTREHHPARHGIGGIVYSNVLMIEATLRLIESAEDSWRIPADNRRLVEAATNPETLEQLAESLGGPWLDHANAWRGAELAQRNEGDGRALDWTAPFDTWGNNEKAATRLGDPGRLVRVEPTVQSPFGQTLRELQIPQWMLGNVERHEELAGAVQTEAGTTTFTFAQKAYRYSRLGLDAIS